METVTMPASEYQRTISDAFRATSDSEYLREQNARLRKELARSIQYMEQLAGTANAIAEAHGLGRKVRAEDFTEQALAALAA